MKTADTIGIYIHIPFCRSKCPYCDFHSALAPKAIQQQYLTALLDEIRTQRRAASFLTESLPPVASVYIGGGTPSYFGGERIAQILYAIQENYTLTDDAEVTVEVNPDSASEDFFRAIYAAGANRISLGLQSAVDSERRALGRLSGAAAATRAVAMARENGLEDYFMGYTQKAGFVGHGVGIEVNEAPVLAPRSKDILVENQIIALEPKFVIPHVGAVGIEDTYVVTADGLQAITTAPVEMIPLL